MTAREPLAREDARRDVRRDSRPHLFNRRDDAWGGTLENRARLLLDAVCRMLLNDPHWPLHAAKTLQARDLAWPVQYERANIF